MPSVFYEWKGCLVMKRLAILMAVFAFCFAGCEWKAEESQVDSIIDVYTALPLPELHLTIPEHFETTSSEFYEEYYICDDASIIITQDMANAPYSSVHDYAISALVEYEKVTEELEMHNDEIVYAGAAAVQVMEFTYTIGKDDKTITKTSMVGYLTDRDSMYIITCKSDVDTYEDYRDDFMSVITSARFLK